MTRGVQALVGCPPRCARPPSGPAIGHSILFCQRLAAECLAKVAVSVRAPAPLESGGRGRSGTHNKPPAALSGYCRPAQNKIVELRTACVAAPLAQRCRAPACAQVRHSPRCEPAAAGAASTNSALSAYQETCHLSPVPRRGDPPSLRRRRASKPGGSPPGCVGAPAPAGVATALSSLFSLCVGMYTTAGASRGRSARPRPNRLFAARRPSRALRIMAPSRRRALICLHAVPVSAAGRAAAVRRACAEANRRLFTSTHAVPMRCRCGAAGPPNELQLQSSAFQPAATAVCSRAVARGAGAAASCSIRRSSRLLAAGHNLSQPRFTRPRGVL